MVLQPTAIKLLTNGQLEIAWSDDQVRHYAVRELRNNCPCATCIEKRSAGQPVAMLPILRPEELGPLGIAKMEPRGRYAYGIHFSDGHDTGIFTLELLRELGSAVP